MKQIMRLFLVADDGSGEGGGIVYVKMKDPYDSSVEVDVPKHLEGFIGHVASFNRKKAAEKASSDLDDLKMKIEDMTLELNDAKKKGGSGSKEVENLKAEHEKSVKALMEKHAETEKLVETFRNKFNETKIHNDLFSVMPVNDLFSPVQTMDLLRQKGNARLIEKIDIATGKGTGEYETVLTLNVKDSAGNIKQADYSPKDAVKAFLSMEENAFHLKNKLAPGGGTNGSRQGESTGVLGDNLQSQLDDAIKRKDLAAQVAIEEQIFEKQTGIKL
jgi:hypothetical protein